MGKLGFESVVPSSSGNSMFGVHFPEKKSIVNYYITNSLAYFPCACLSWLPRAVVLKRSCQNIMKSQDVCTREILLTYLRQSNL